jgi:hypothetical protein
LKADGFTADQVRAGAATSSTERMSRTSVRSGAAVSLRTFAPVYYDEVPRHYQLRPRASFATGVAYCLLYFLHFFARFVPSVPAASLTPKWTRCRRPDINPLFLENQPVPMI